MVIKTEMSKIGCSNDGNQTLKQTCTKPRASYIQGLLSVLLCAARIIWTTGTSKLRLEKSTRYVCGWMQAWGVSADKMMHLFLESYKRHCKILFKSPSTELRANIQTARTTGGTKGKGLHISTQYKMRGEHSATNRWQVTNLGRLPRVPPSVKSLVNHSKQTQNNSTTVHPIIPIYVFQFSV